MNVFRGLPWLTARAFSANGRVRRYRQKKRVHLWRFLALARFFQKTRRLGHPAFTLGSTFNKLVVCMSTGTGTQWQQASNV